MYFLLQKYWGGKLSVTCHLGEKMLVVSSGSVWLDYSVMPLPEASIEWTYFFFFFNAMILEAGWNRRKSAGPVICKILKAASRGRIHLGCCLVGAGRSEISHRK